MIGDEGITFEPAPDIDEKVAELSELGETTMAIAQHIADVARREAPVGETGDYLAGIEVQKTKHGARVFASDFKSAWLEFGVPSQGKPARFILRRAVEAAGYTFKKRG